MHRSIQKIVRILLFSVILTIIPFALIAQTGGNNTYQFLTLTNSARIAALGNNAIVVEDNDLTLVTSNPSLISENSDNAIALSFTDFVTDINYGFATYSHTFKKVGSFAGTLNFINYGRFTYADETGQTYGNFNAGEYALTIGWGRMLAPHFRIGSNLKLIYSDIQDYNSTGIAVDVAGSYLNAEKKIAVSMLLRNIGRQLDAYIPGNIEPIPFSAEINFSKQFEHLPLRIHLQAIHLEKWDLTYQDPANPDPIIDPITGDSLPKRNLEKFADKLIRHFVVGAEFMPTKNFYIRLGYNYQRRKELQIDAKKAFTGFSYGIGFRISKFDFSYARVHYALGATPNYITISTNISEFLSKKNNK